MAGWGMGKGSGSVAGWGMGKGSGNVAGWGMGEKGLVVCMCSALP